MLVTAPTIARLTARPRLWAYRQIMAKRFGPITRRKGRALEVELNRVQAVFGTFTPEQLAAAGVPEEAA